MDRLMLPWDDPHHDVMDDIVGFRRKAFERGSGWMTPIMGSTYVPIKLIIALDPGGTTGVAAYWPDTRIDQERAWERKQIEECDKSDNLKLLFRVIGHMMVTVQPFLAKPSVHIIYETFDFRMAERYRDKIDYTACEVIGALKYWAVDRDFVKLIPVGAGLGKGFWTDDRIKTLGLWVPGQRHAMDATRHLLRYRTFTLDDMALLRMFKPHVGEPKLDRSIEEVHLPEIP